MSDTHLLPSLQWCSWSTSAFGSKTLDRACDVTMCAPAPGNTPGYLISRVPPVLCPSNERYRVPLFSGLELMVASLWTTDSWCSTEVRAPEESPLTSQIGCH